jgi:ankyrin repeat protein
VPPCVEVALRTFINTILVDPRTNLLSFDALPQGITVNSEFKAFIEKHKDPALQNYYTNTKDEWMALTSDKSSVKYLRGTTEMAGAMDNSLALLNHYFGTDAKTLAEFGKILSTNTKEIIIDEKDEPYGNYNIAIKTPYKNFDGQWAFAQGHVNYFLEEENSINFSLMDFLRLSKIKKGQTSLLSIIPKNQQRSIFIRSVNRNLHEPSWTFDALEKTCKILNLDLATFLFEDDSNFLHKAIEHDRLDLIEPLVGAGINLEQKNHLSETPVLVAIRRFNNIPIMEALVKLGANINVGNRWGDTVLHIAVTMNNLPMIEALIRLGTDINLKNEWCGDTVLHKAIKMDNLPMIEALIRLGADINLKNKWGCTVLHEAVKMNNLPMIETFIKSGAHVNEKDQFGNTPLDQADRKSVV